ncbi:hypothetical protein TIFTF001_038617 [Ficus carica]|uniref:Uncharacterized protein n=1 Tax=Ficus carica TaxID=3494 RepID=A0AA88E975_FICCA|nr:hypothetical protein TIFTF001_038617 [Ficus carica]
MGVARCCLHKKFRRRPATAPRAGDPCSSSPESRIVGVWPRHSPPFAGKLLGKFRSTPVNAGQRWSTPVNAGQSWSKLVNAGQLSPNFGRSPFRPIFDVPDMFTTSDLRYEI